MSHTITPEEIHHPAPRISSSPGSSEKLPPLWIYLSWTMLLSVDAALILLAGGTTASGKQGSFEKPT
jgi:hypothetical protein